MAKSTQLGVIWPFSRPKTSGTRIRQQVIRLRWPVGSFFLLKSRCRRAASLIAAVLPRRILQYASVRSSRSPRIASDIAISVLASALFVASPLSVQAAPGYAGTVDKKAVTVELNPGEARWLTLTYTNTGSNTWYRDARTQYVSLYLVGEKTSPIGGRGWRTNESPAKIRDAAVKPGAKTVVTFQIFGNAPGTYTHKLRLASEDTAWMYGAETALTVKVKGASAVSGQRSAAPGSRAGDQPAAASRAKDL